MRTSAAQFATVVRRIIACDEGQDLLEYGLLVSLIALGAIGMVRLVGVEVNALFSDIVAGLQQRP